MLDVNDLVIDGLELVQLSFRERDVIVWCELERFDDLLRRNYAVFWASPRLLNAAATSRMDQVQRAIALSHGCRVAFHRNRDRAEFQRSRPTTATRWRHERGILDGNFW